MPRFKILETDEAINDVTNIAIYIFDEYRDEVAAERFIDRYSEAVKPLKNFPTGFRGISIEHRGYEIRFFPFQSYNIFFIIRDDRRDVVILRVLHQLQDWTHILQFDNVYHLQGMML